MDAHCLCINNYFESNIVELINKDKDVSVITDVSRKENIRRGILSCNVNRAPYNRESHVCNIRTSSLTKDIKQKWQRSE